MSECKPTQKNGVSTNTGLSSISKILNILSGAFNMMKKPAPTVPPALLLIGSQLKPGMSGRDLAANVISRMESEAGIPMGDIFADGPNGISATILVQELEHISHLQQNASIQVPMITPTGAPITVKGIIF